MPKIFKDVSKKDGELLGCLPGKGWKTVVSINDVPGAVLVALAEEMNPDEWDEEFNSDLEGLLRMKEKDCSDGFHIVYTTESGKEESITVPRTDKKALEAVRKNFEGITAVALAAGLTEADVAAIFAGTLMEFKGGKAGMDMNNMMSMDGLMEHMTSQMPNVDPQNCSAQ